MKRKRFYAIILKVKIFWLMVLKAPPPSKKSVFARKVEIKINAWEDSLESDLSETLWLFN
jgi:hypothetical protein